MSRANWFGALVLFIWAIAPGLAHASTVFFDDFNSGASAAWGNDTGSWTTAGGTYFAQTPNNYPNAHSFVSTLSLTDATITTDVLGSTDGGVWIRAANDASGIGANGILLVTRSNQLYWHVVIGGSYGAIFDSAPINVGPNYTLRIEAVGNTYSAYVNNTFTTQLVSNAFTTGMVGLYDFSGQHFDNFSIETTGIR